MAEHHGLSHSQLNQLRELATAVAQSQRQSEDRRGKGSTREPSESTRVYRAAITLAAWASTQGGGL